MKINSNIRQHTTFYNVHYTTQTWSKNRKYDRVLSVDGEVVVWWGMRRVTSSAGTADSKIARVVPELLAHAAKCPGLEWGFTILHDGYAVAVAESAVAALAPAPVETDGDVVLAAKLPDSGNEFAPVHRIQYRTGTRDGETAPSRMLSLRIHFGPS